MQLRTARLCLDCEEVHDDPHCPVCASDSFAYLSRWVPVDERRSPKRPTARPATVEPRRGAGKRLVAGGALGVGVWALSRWLSRPSAAKPAKAENAANGENIEVSEPQAE